MNNLKQLLEGYDANVLKEIARAHGVDVKGQVKSTIVNPLVRVLTRPEQVAQTLEQLRPVEREILTRLLRVGGEAVTRPFQRVAEKAKLVAVPPQRKDRWGGIDYNQPRDGNAHYTGTPTFVDVIARLTLFGLVFSYEPVERSKQIVGWDLGIHLVVPLEIRNFLPPPPPAEIKTAAEPARIVPGSARTFQRDLSRYWSFVKRNGELPVTTQGWVYKKSLGEIAKALGWAENKKLDEKNDLYPFFLRQMLSALDLIQPEATMEWDKPTRYFPKQGKEFWALPPTERIKRSFEAWIATTTWNELRIPKAKYGMDARRPAPPELRDARNVVLGHLQRLATAGWVTVNDLLDAVRLADYEFLFPRPRGASYLGYDYGGYNSPYYNSNNHFGITYDHVKNEAEGWDQIEGAIITHMLAGPLNWLGLVDVGLDQDGETPRAYRLTALGAWLFGVGAPITIAEEGGRVVVQPNFQIVAMEPLSESVLMTLQDFADFEGGDHALTYRLTREAVYRAQRANWDSARISAYLEDVTHMPLPQNVKRSLAEWQLLHERITIRRGVTLLQTENSATLDELFANAALAPILGRRVIEQVALPSESANKVADALRAHGWLPVITPRNRTDAPASVIADAEGHVTFAHCTPSIYAYRGIEAFAELTDARTMQITPASVSAAVAQKFTVPELLTRLRAVHRGELPPQLIQRIKAWGKFYGDARGGVITLIEFRDEAARNELLADPELQPDLTRFEAGTRPLALVRADALARVIALLAERGVDVREWTG